MTDPWAATFSNDLAAVRAAVGADPSLVHKVSADRKSTLLYVASRFGHEDIVRLLVSSGANANKANESEDQSTPLHGACFGGHPNVVRFLLSAGADPARKNAYGELPKHNAKAPAEGVTKDRAKACLDWLKAPPPPMPPAPAASAPVPQVAAPSPVAVQPPPAPVTPPKAPEPVAAPAAPLPQPPQASVPAAPQTPAVPLNGPQVDDDPAMKLQMMTLPELRKLAASLGVAGSGTKAAVVQRIIAAGGPAAVKASDESVAKPASPSPVAKKNKAEASAPAVPATAAAVSAAWGAAQATDAPPKAAEAASPVAGDSGAPSPFDDAWIAALKSATFTKTEVERDTEEFWGLEERVMACNQGHNEDYVTLRLKKKKKPLTFIVKRAWRVVNPVLEQAFKETLDRLAAEDKSLTRVRAAFHGTKEENIDNILRTCLLRFKHPLNPCKTQADDGYFGTNRKGVYVSRYFDYTLKYSNDLTPLDEGQCAKVIMFKCLPGRSRRIEKLTMGMEPSEGFHSHSSPSFLEWYLFDERQLCPEYVVELQAKIDTRTAADDE